jgi:hypothetical protein
MMYLVMVELNARPADQYPDFEKAVKALGNWSNRIRGAWFIESPFSASQIRDLLKPTLVAGQDKLFVTQMSQNWAGSSMGAGFPEWLKRRKFERVRPQ